MGLPWIFDHPWWYCLQLQVMMVNRASHGRHGACTMSLKITMGGALMPEFETRVFSVLEQLRLHYGEQRWWCSENRLADWLAMILIQRTTQGNAEKALAGLADVLTLEALLALDEAALQARIRPAGFFRQKSVYIRALLNWFAAQGGDLAAFAGTPTDVLRRELLSLPGIGNETADAMLLYMFGRKVFIADSYALRLFQRLGLSDARDYQHLRAQCMPLMEGITLHTAQEWHAVIDEHGKAFRKQPQMDESWLRLL